MTDLCIFTANYPDVPEGIALLRRSCELFGNELRTYGDQSWPGLQKGKIHEARRFLEMIEEPFSMFVDGHDSIVLASAKDILDQYQRIGTLIVVSGEKTCWPESSIASQYPYPQAPFHNSPWRFINSGGWIGETSALVEALACMEERAEKFSGFDDQRVWADWFIHDSWARLVTRIDAGCQIFQCMGGVGSHELGPGGENLVTHSFPKVLHFNGRTPNMGLWYRNLTGDLGWKGQ